jgi:hypothetical protein
MRIVVHPIGLCAALALAAGCETRNDLRVTRLASPAAAAPLSLNLAAGPAGELAVTWLEARDAGGYVFRLALGDSAAWSEPRAIAAGPTLATHPTDLPGVAFLSDGTILAWWQERPDWSPNPYETDVRTALSHDQGMTWSEASRPYRLPTSGEHGFVATWPAGSGVGLAWLDARRQTYQPAADSTQHGIHGGSMALFAAVVNAAGTTTGEMMVDSVTCECCPTAAALTGRGPVVVYRDRELPADVERTGVLYEQEVIRDIAITRFEGGRWSDPRLVHRDGWAYSGCPNNGPAVAARGDRLVVAWMTGAGGKTAVYAAFSADAGDSFGEPIRIDEGQAVGQVTVALARDSADAAVVGWLEGSQVMTRQVTSRGERGPGYVLGPSAGRTRLPPWVTRGDVVVASWLSGGGTGPATVEVALIRTAAAAGGRQALAGDLTVTRTGRRTAVR